MSGLVSEAKTRPAHSQTVGIESGSTSGTGTGRAMACISSVQRVLATRNGHD